MKPELSIVIPLYNEAEGLSTLYARLKASLEIITGNYEIIFVNDGSKDSTLVKIQDICRYNSLVKYISFTRNFGHQNAIAAGIAAASGAAIITMDGDLQDPPELINDLYQKFNAGFKVVYARRKARTGESYFKKATAKFFYRLLKRITSVDIPLDTGDFRLISGVVADNLKKLKESNKFLRGQIAWLGYTATFVDFDRPNRFSGITKYTTWRMIRFALDGITSFSSFPLQIASLLGFVFSFVAFLLIIYSLYSKFILDQVVTGWTSLMISTMLIGGIQLLCLGLMGEYMMRVANDVKKRPSYIVAETNIDIHDSVNKMG